MVQVKSQDVQACHGPRPRALEEDASCSPETFEWWYFASALACWPLTSGRGSYGGGCNFDRTCDPLEFAVTTWRPLLNSFFGENPVVTGSAHCLAEE